MRLPGGERVSVYGATRAEATEAAAKLLRDARLGVSVVDARQPFADYLDRWMEIHGQTIAEGTREAYARHIRLVIAPLIGSVRLCDLAPYHLERVFATMRADGRRSYKGVYTVLHAALRAAFRQSLIVRNVLDLVTVPADVQGEPFYAFSPEEARAYIALGLAQHPPFDRSPKGLNQGARLGPLLALMLLTGLRVGEALSLSWRDVDLPSLTQQTRPAHRAQRDREPSLSVQRSLRWMYGDPIFKEPKTQRSKRRVLLTPQAIEALTRSRQIQRAERLRAGDAWVSSLIAVGPTRAGERITFPDLVFTDEIGRPLREQSVHYQHHKLCRLAGVPVNRPHDLRHSFATLMLRAGVNPKIVSEMLGHSSVTMTLNRYSHVLPDMQRGAVSALAQLLADPDTHEEHDNHEEHHEREATDD